jgi:hypothetical protein
MRRPHSLRSNLALALTAVLISGGASSGQMVDITGSGSSGTIGNARFFESDQQPAGTGNIRSFLRVQASPTEQGYNTDGGFPFDDKNPHNFQHSLLLSDLSTFTLNGTAYFKFMLDANQSGQSGHDFTLTQMQVYTSNSGSQTTTSFNADGTLPLGNLAYNLNPGGGTTNSVLTHATGSGAFDAVVFIPVSDFNLSDKYVTLYFAGQGNGGFEEWTAAEGVATVPEPSGILLVLSSLPFAGYLLRRRRIAAE